MMFISERRRRARRRRLALGAGAVLASFAVAGAVGVILPLEHLTRDTAVFERSAETVWRVLTDLDGMPLWRSDLTAVERLPDLDGKTVWREVSRGGSQVLELSRQEPPFRLVTQGAVAGRPAYPMRTVELVPIDRGTRVTITERAEVSNPIFRVLVRLDPSRSAVQRFLHDLDQRLQASRNQVASDGMQ